MQPQDQNYQNDTQNGQQGPSGDPAPLNDDGQIQPQFVAPPNSEQDQPEPAQEVLAQTEESQPNQQQPVAEEQQENNIQTETVPQMVDTTSSQEETPAQPQDTPIAGVDGLNSASEGGLSSNSLLGSDNPQSVTDASEPFGPDVSNTLGTNSEEPVLPSAEQPAVVSSLNGEDIPPIPEVSPELTDQNAADLGAITEPSTEETFAPETISEPTPTAERVSLTDHGSFTPQEPQTIANTTQATPEEKDNIYTEICGEIIKEQEQIIGTLAVEQANYVEGLTVDPVTYHCIVSGDGSKVIDDLIEQYRDFFGHAAVEVCKEAASRFLARLPAEEMPTSLR